jgi:hypothetical protein
MARTALREERVLLLDPRSCSIQAPPEAHPAPEAHEP